MPVGNFRGVASCRFLGDFSFLPAEAILGGVQAGCRFLGEIPFLTLRMPKERWLLARKRVGKEQVASWGLQDARGARSLVAWVAVGC